MVVIDRNHDPRNNAELISRLSGNSLRIDELVHETNELFKEAIGEHTPSKMKSVTGLYAFFSNFTASLRRIIQTKSAFDNARQYDTVVDEKGNVIPEWMVSLDDEYKHLLAEIDREVHLEDFGAIGDGKTDCTEAFRMALSRGHVKVVIPEGVYVVKEIKLPSFTYLVGAGKRKTVIKLHDSAPKGRRLMTNKNHRTGNRNVYVQGVTLDWNVERLGNVEKTSTWGNHSSCLLYANVKYGWVKDVEAVNPGLHCFDISSPLYNYYGDGYRARGGSEYIWLDNLTGSGFGDDGITTHHSDNIFISNCHMSDPSGKTHKKGFSNSNGIEIDDGSRNVWLFNNSTARDYVLSLELSSYLVTVNGGEIWAPNGELVDRSMVDTEHIQWMYDLSQKHKTGFWATSSENVWRNEMPEHLFSHEWIKFGFHIEEDNIRESVMNELKEKGLFEISNSSLKNIEVNALGINKARGLQKVCNLLGISMENVMAVGDSLNDIAMITEAGIGIAMGNAQEIVKEAAEDITGTNNESGVAQAIQKWVL